MDRRSWLWRRKSSDKSTGETESSGSGSGSGSISSPSERFSDDPQGYANLTPQSPEISSKDVVQDEDVNDSLKILREKLCNALANVSAKEELVEQHAKVAEEAVSGWEKAEKEATSLKHQLNVAANINTSLEDRIIHLDGALKECLRQLRQVREEQDQKILEAIAKKSQDSESKTSNELQTQLGNLHVQLETANAEIEAFASLESDLHVRLGSAEKENASLQRKLQTLSEELEVRTLERDLSTKTAETASKQHLESIKKVAKLEAECRRLKSVARKANSFNDHKLLNVNRSKLENSSTISSVTSSDSISLMDDFLEMERLVALPVRENRTTELEKKIEMFEEEKQELGKVLTEHQNQLRTSQAQLKDANNKLSMLQSELDLASDLRQAIELELDDANVRKQEVESQLKYVDNGREILQSKVNLLENEAEKERARSAEISAKYRALEDEVSRIKREAETREGSVNANREEAESQLTVVQAEAKSLLDKCTRLEEELSRMKLEADSWKSQLTSANNSKEAVERELEMTNAKKYSVESQLKSLLDKCEKERLLSAEFSSKCKGLEDKVLKLKCGAEFRVPTKSKEELDIQQEKELSVAAASLAECQKTIASLGKQLKSLANFDDLFLDSNKVIEKESQLVQNCAEKVIGKESQLVQNCEKTCNLPTGNKVTRESGEEGLSSKMADKSQKSGFGKLFPRSKSAMRSRYL